MQLEKVDIKELSEGISQGNLVKIDVKPYSLLDQELDKLLSWGGDLGAYLGATGLPPEAHARHIFKIETELARPENKDLKDLWESAIKRSGKIRINLLKCKAFSMLEQFRNLSKTSAASEVAFCKTVLNDIAKVGAQAKEGTPEGEDELQKIYEEMSNDR